MDRYRHSYLQLKGYLSCHYLLAKNKIHAGIIMILTLLSIIIPNFGSNLNYNIFH